MPRSSLLPLERRLGTHLRLSCPVSAGSRLGVAVSGGADSVALLRLLLALQGKFGVTLHVLHFHHSLRGADADADAEFVRSLAQAHKLEFIFERQDVPAAAKKNHWNLEDAARRLRYAFLESAVSSGRVTRVATAHTADDQAETVLAHLIRGTGPRGLAGIHPATGNVFRPLLEFRRDELREYLKSLGQPWREDLSNLDLHRTRARIRARLLPQLESEFSPRIVDHLSTLARLSREEEAFWDSALEACFRSCVDDTPDGLRIRAEHLLAPPPFAFLAQAGQSGNASRAVILRPLTERLVRRLYEKARGERSAPSASHVEQVVALAETLSSGHRLELPGGVEVERSFADLFFRARSAAAESAATPSLKTAGATAAYRYSVSIPKRGETVVSVPEIGICFRLKVIDWPLPERDTKTYRVALDADLLRAPVVLRNWRPGDAYRPHGRRQSSKVKQLFLVHRIPLRQRSGWPVLESAGHVIWARGFPPAAEFSACGQTRSGVLIEEFGL
jgi:tRNA(Ile)-lysidine synthase